jgi:hypothetical protein
MVVFINQTLLEERIINIYYMRKLKEVQLYMINRQCITSYIKHLAVSGLSSILARIKGSCYLTGKCVEMPNASYTNRYSQLKKNYESHC